MIIKQLCRLLAQRRQIISTNNIDTTHGVTSGTSTINNEEIENANFSSEIIRSFPKAAMKERARI